MTETLSRSAVVPRYRGVGSKVMTYGLLPEKLSSVKYGFLSNNLLAARAIDAALIDGAPKPMLLAVDGEPRPVRELLPARH